MSNEFDLNATAREDLGKGASRRLRRLANEVPAIIYGGTKAPQNISIPHKDILKATSNEAFFSHIITLHVDGKKEQVVIKDLQRHPGRMARFAAARDAGADPYDVVFGPDRAGGGTSAWSAWWVYADNLRGAPVPSPEIGTEIARLTTSSRAGVRAGLANKVGSASVVGAPVTLVWSGNRMCRPAGLLPEEAARTPH